MEALYSTTGISSGDGRDGRAALADGSLELTWRRQGDRREG